MGDEQPNCLTLLGPILHKGCASSPATSLPCLRGQLRCDLYEKASFPTQEPKKKNKSSATTLSSSPWFMPAWGSLTAPGRAAASWGEKPFFTLKIVSAHSNAHRVSPRLCQTAGLPRASQGHREGLWTISKSPWWSLLSLYDFISVTVMFLRVKNNINFPYLVVFWRVWINSLAVSYLGISKPNPAVGKPLSNTEGPWQRCGRQRLTSMTHKHQVRTIKKNCRYFL